MHITEKVSTDPTEHTETLVLTKSELELLSKVVHIGVSAIVEQTIAFDSDSVNISVFPELAAAISNLHKLEMFGDNFLKSVEHDPYDES